VRKIQEFYPFFLIPTVYFWKFSCDRNRVNGWEEAVTWFLVAAFYILKKFQKYTVGNILLFFGTLYFFVETILF